MKVGVFLKEIRIEHTLFALPFAYVGAIVAARSIPSWTALVWITLAVLGARTSAMAINRYLDRDIDARNPRTARRALANGTLSPAAMLWATAAGLALLVLAAWMLNPLCVKLLPIAAILLLAYPLCKRFTWTTHFVLGAVDALAPLGAYVAISG
ncbi:MAG TPA: UbiA family prenyltransferase, partial [Candidatus Tumulicola sp.]